MMAMNINNKPFNFCKEKLGSSANDVHERLVFKGQKLRKLYN